jgi:hypothetical protein
MDVHRDDGAILRIDGPGRPDPLPHDLVHLIVEAELQLVNGFWGQTANGRIYGPVTFLRAPDQPRRRPPKPRPGGGEVERLAAVV